MSATYRPTWNRQNLEKHCSKRNKQDASCWHELLGSTQPMSVNDYEKASLDAYEKAILEYEAEELDNMRAICRVDKRTVKTIRNVGSGVLRTCYHEHYNHPHEKDSTTATLVENISRYLRALENRASGGVVTLYRIDLVKKNIKKSRHRAKGSPLVVQTDNLRINHLSK